MAELLIIYALLALTTAIASAFTILVPVLKELSREQPDNTLVENPLLTYLTYISIGIIVAPILFVPTILPTYNEIFKEHLLKSIKD